MNQRIKQLDSFRFIFAIIILLSHIDYLSELETTRSIYTLLIKPKYAVNYFFMLSGFGIYINSNKINQLLISIKNNISFAVKKIEKTYPFYLLSLLLGLPLVIYNTYKYTNTIFLSTAKLIIKIVLCIVMGQSITGIKDFSHAINGVCWFTSCLFICYMLCPIFIRILNNINNKKKLLIFTVVIISCCIFASFCGWLIDSKGIEIMNMTINDIEYGHPLVRIWYVVLGMCVAKFNMFNSKKLDLGITNELFIYLFFILYYLFSDRIFVFSKTILLFDLIVDMLFIYMLTNVSGQITKLLSNEKLFILGKDSMLIYYFHYPINQIIGFYILYHNEIFANNQYLYVLAFVIEILVDYFVVTLVKKNSERIRNYKMLNNINIR